MQYLTDTVSLGWIIRSLHRWSASIMLVNLLLHISRVYITGGFKNPREITWVSGVLLACLSVSFGVTGYSLPWDQVGFWACKIVTGVPDAIPLIGAVLVESLRGGASVGQATLSRFYTAHTFLLPVLTVLILVGHFSMIRKQGISGPL